MTKSAAGKIPARSRAHVLLWFVGIFGEENRVLELVAGMKLIAQLLDLLPDKRRDLALGNSALQARIIRVLRGQAPQKCPDKIDVSMWNAHLRIPPIELERMTSLTIVGESDSLIESTVRLRLVTIIAIQLLSVHGWNVGSEMALVIEPKSVGISRVDAF